ncbi:MAG TPA: NAD-dependent epimerase/dehydratase family protein [Dongiaceae bacterium]|nr:NAD-dependent epimerase/dehydratase family protein [Dongiaceae bacterium]
MRILVTGGTGFTGKALTLRLIGDGHQVVVLDYKEGLRTGELRQAGAEVLIGSVTDAGIVKRAVRDVEVVHHLAAAFRELNVPEEHYRQVNVDGTRNVLDAAVAAGVRRLVYCSTCGVHGDVKSSPANEDAPIAPADYYQRTKYMAEPIVTKYAEEARIETVTLRPAAIYGPGDLERFAMIYRQVAKGWFPMFGDGKAFYHPNYIDNLVDAFVLAQNADAAVSGRAYLIADEEYLMTEDLVRRVAKAIDVDVSIRRFPLLPARIAGHICEVVCRPIGISPPIFPRRVDWYRQNRAFSIDRARSELGYIPRVSIDEGLWRTGEWYKREGIIPSGLAAA